VLKRPRYLIAAAAVALAGSTAVVLTTNADADSASTTVDAESIQLAADQNFHDAASGLASVLPQRTVSDVVESGNRTAKECKAPAENRSASFCWAAGDGSTSYWMPQGITTSADATASGTYDGHEVMITSWYDNGSHGADRGARLSFIDMSDPKTPTYRHVLLVQPSGTAAEPDFTAVKTHAGGITWIGDKLYVSDTYDGIRVFDMNHIFGTSAADPEAIGLQDDGSYQARGYTYVMPQVASYNPSTIAPTGKLRYSQVSVDRTSQPAGLVVSEFGNPGDGTRIARFDLDGDGALAVDQDGTVRADEAYTMSFRSVQGATAIDGIFYTHRSNGPTGKSGVITWEPGHKAQVQDKTLPIGTEDVSYWESRDQLWSLTEYAGKRYVYATKASAW
jgi:hypothetical protein